MRFVTEILMFFLLTDMWIPVSCIFAWICFVNAKHTIAVVWSIFSLGWCKINLKICRKSTTKVVGTTWLFFLTRFLWGSRKVYLEESFHHLYFCLLLVDCLKGEGWNNSLHGLWLFPPDEDWIQFLCALSSPVHLLYEASLWVYLCFSSLSTVFVLSCRLLVWNLFVGGCLSAAFSRAPCCCLFHPCRHCFALASVTLKVSKAAGPVLWYTWLWVRVGYCSQPGVPALGWISLARTFVVALQCADRQIDVAWGSANKFFSSEPASGESGWLVFMK